MGTLFSISNRERSTPLPETEKLDWLQLYRSENVGPVTFFQLLEYYENAQNAIKALPELAKRGGRKKPLLAASRSVIEKEYAALKKLGGDIITAACPDYPLALGAADDAPPVISYLGNPALLQKSCIALVGARNASINGKKFAHKLANELGAKGQIIVSGLARGIDTSAHQGALNTGTIAVVAGGVDDIYPEENAALYAQIKESGLILAESPLGQKPFSTSFPRRNRIVAGLSKGVVVVEATMRSGSLITARLAGEYGRDVYAVPGHPMDPRADGPNHLIREGATLVRNADDIIEHIMDFSGNALREPFYPLPDFTPPFGSRASRADEIPENAHTDILEILSFTPISVDEIIRSCTMNIGSLQSVLLDLELAGHVKRLPGNRIQLVGTD